MDIYDEENASRRTRAARRFRRISCLARCALGQIQRDNFRKAVRAGLKLSFRD